MDASEKHASRLTRRSSTRGATHLHQRLLSNLPHAPRALPHPLHENVVRNGGVAAGDAIEHVIKGKFRILRTAGLAAQDGFLDLAESPGVHEDDVLLFR